jgi:hypothetical protein
MTRRLLWPVLAITGALYGAMLLWSLPHLSALAGGRAMFDMRPGGYGYDEAVALVAALGEGGRSFYLNVQQRLDTAFPVFEAASFALLFVRLYPRRAALPLALLAAAAALCDELENAAVAVMLRTGADGLSVPMVATASRWTLLKSIGTSLLFGALLLGIAAALWRRWRARA